MALSLREAARRVVDAAGGLRAQRDPHEPDVRCLLELAEALEADRTVAVAEDPVREAARQQLALDPEHTSVALAEALARPAPPSLSEDERRAVWECVGDTLATVILPSRDPALLSAQKKLVRRREDH